ncbi:tRNA cyclic N6-threonylcarbamoyladenosine(37) synthase TcdA [Jeongeupia naejangsanensis]|uniref:tRNA cyclic N6-threonylcarbamoyladenosine(37) synthase TcdA n=1 Tax=Jeongeupia naejangsanensis TaxID=613195 RepID=A0ABS2BFX1_9NEIS|nr:tRNA cyclic N6-threonylcarbamoyladenosine(37) synthase TcdA [Jeongeupia naejangsanensis]MBM3114508.1 tRNA cyclic N6-threonylcarbamoyladenosine(37) synthase TcdA [Jeongeupia naejangsanensis]
MDTSYERRFGGIARLYGAAALARFRSAHVCVIGVGGVGSWSAEALARSGIGAITLIDLDDICVSNTNRQLPALVGQYGKMKVAALAERIVAINPECRVTCVEDFVDADNLAELLGVEFDYVVDAIDSVKTKAALIHWCRRNKVNLITTGGAGGQIDPTQVQVTDLSRTTQDPLASKVRSILRREYGFPKGDKKFGIDCVFSTEPLVYPQLDGSVCAQKPAAGDSPVRLDCEGGFGASVAVTGTFGFVAVAHLLKKLATKV